jgi:hypothetical protein
MKEMTPSPVGRLIIAGEFSSDILVVGEVQIKWVLIDDFLNSLRPMA